MQLMTKEIESRMPKFYATEDIPTEEKVLQVKFFHPMSNWTWYGVEYDQKTRTFFGYVQGFENEWGYFSLDELESVKVHGLGIERDLYFEPQKFSHLFG
jgi:hypothetical protein